MSRSRAFVDRPALASARTAVATGDRSGALLVGGPRVGKSALLEHLLAELSSAGAMSSGERSLVRVRPVRGTSQLAGGAFLPLLDVETPIVSNAQLCRELLRLLLPPGTEQPWLVIDDMHLLDDLSLGLLSQLLGDERLRLLAAVRTDAHAELTGRCPAVAEAAVIEVDAFSEQELAELASSRLGVVLDPRTTARLAALVAGDPGLFEDVLAAGVREDRVHDRWGFGVWDGELTVPTGSRAGLQQPLRGLERPARQVLDLLALVQPVELDLLLTLLDADTVEELESCGLVHVERSGARHSVRLRTPALGRVLHQDLAASRARRLARAAGAVLAGFGGRRPEDDLRLALLAEVSGDPVVGPVRVRALEHALHTGQVGVAERLARSWPAQHVVPPLLQARLLLLRRDLAAADRLLAELDDGPSGDPAITALRARTLLWALGDPGAARALHTRSGRRQDAGWTGIDLLAQALQGQVAPVAEQAGVARRSPAQLDGHGRFALATSQLELGQVTGVPELVAGTGAADDDLHAALTGTAGRAHLLQGEVAKAEQVAEALAGQRRGAAVVLAEASLLRGLVELHRGRPGRGAVHLRTALALSDDGDWPLRRVRALALLAVSLAWSGSAARAGEVLAEAASTAAAWPGLALAAAAVELARAETLLATGALRSAHDLASEWAAVAEDAGRLTDAVLALHLASRAQPTPHVAHGLRRLAERCEFALARLHADYATALAERDGRGLLAVADRYREAGAVPVSAEAVLQAAAVFHERGRSTMAATATVQGEALVDALEFPAPPWWPAPGGAVLTPREWEIAALAAQGMGSRTIADRLHLSTRTVDNHLQHCFRKLGISSRSELGGVLHARRSPGWSGRSPTPP